MEKEMSPMTTEILKKGYLLFPIPRRYTRFGVSLWNMPDPDNGNVDMHWTYGGYEYVSNQDSHPTACDAPFAGKGNVVGCVANRAPSLQAADFLFFIAWFIVYASKNKEIRIHSSCLQKGYVEVLLQGSDSSESRCVLKCYYL